MTHMDYPQLSMNNLLWRFNQKANTIVGIFLLSICPIFFNSIEQNYLAYILETRYNRLTT